MLKKDLRGIHNIHKSLSSLEKNENIVFNGKEIEPGANEIVRLHIGKLASGTRINLYAHIYRSVNPGPTALLIGGLHGNEINGIEILRRAIESGKLEKLKKGSVIAIPLLNVYGFLSFTRDIAEGKDINRSFPGSVRGSLASRLARSLSKKVLPQVDFGIDFHCGGDARYNYPQIRYNKNDLQSEELANAFAAPCLIEKACIAKSLRKTAMRNGKPILIFEGGESSRFDALSIDQGIAGLKRVLTHKGMFDESPPIEHTVRKFSNTRWIRAGHSGMFLWSVASGTQVKKNDLLGYIMDPYGTNRISVLAPKDSFIIGHNNASVINQGDPLFHIAYRNEMSEDKVPKNSNK